MVVTAREWISVAEAHWGCSFRARVRGDQILEVALDFSGGSQGSWELERSSPLWKLLFLSG